MRQILGGEGNVEDNVIEAAGGTYRAIALRSFDLSTSSWAIWWLSSLAPHTMEVPVVGQFQSGDGSFFANDFLRGKPIQVRFLWLKTETDSPRWEQAMSDDQGRTWETNWTMDFRRS